MLGGLAQHGGHQELGWRIGVGAFALVALLFGLVPLRRALLSSQLIGPIGKILPTMSETERQALEAGSVWWDAELFTGAVFEPLDFIARIAALVPRPRAHLLTYHGVLAPAAAWRDHIVPGGSAEKSPSLSSTNSGADCDGHPSPKPARPTRHPWAELMKRVFELDVLVCLHCNGQRSLIAFLTDGPVVRKILLHLGLDSDPPLLAPARALEESVFAW